MDSGLRQSVKFISTNSLDNEVNRIFSYTLGGGPRPVAGAAGRMQPLKVGGIVLSHDELANLSHRERRGMAFLRFNYDYTETLYLRLLCQNFGKRALRSC